MQSQSDIIIVVHSAANKLTVKLPVKEINLTNLIGRCLACLLFSLAFKHNGY